MRILITSFNVSRRMGGEAVLPLHYTRELRALGHDVHVQTHARVRDELKASEIWDAERTHFIEDSFIERAIHTIGKAAPGAIRETVFISAINAVTMARLAGAARRLARDIGADIIHQPAPVSPHFPSFLTDMPAPVVIGPLNGGMSYPPAFEKEFSKGSQAVVRIGRAFSGVGNTLFPGKKRAARILVANERTQNSLPAGVPAERVRLLVENGVDLALWGAGDGQKDHKANFVFVGRLVWWKAVELLIDAFAAVEAEATLTIIGDGPERARLEKHAMATPAFDRIFFEGFRPQAEIRDTLARARALVLPSLRECGGAVVLEAFACGTPAIATRWGGPQDYITDDTGVLVEPDSRETFVNALAAAMNDLAKNPGTARIMGAAARRRVEDNFTWTAKARQIAAIYEDVLAEK